MSRRRSLPDWRVLFAGACALGVFVVCQGLNFGFFVSVFLAVLGAAFVYAGVRARGPARPSVGRGRGPAPLPQIAAGHEVMTVRNLGGGFSEFVPQGSRGVVTGTGWGKVTVSFTIYSPLGTRQVQVQANPDDVRRI
ncbi:hypothetical protein [Amycolatopsis sp. NBC_01480]|uniref:hypothetical protein n=1 Tax=Amycolatopsis sp. NBC_01480 TaxID=2903562 RepID=UPI002E2C64B6|nr:hypothetical protein [Amycolatopsis sp. NBC_01480]